MWVAEQRVGVYQECVIGMGLNVECMGGRVTVGPQVSSGTMWL